MGGESDKKLNMRNLCEWCGKAIIQFGKEGKAELPEETPRELKEIVYRTVLELHILNSRADSKNTLECKPPKESDVFRSLGTGNVTVFYDVVKEVLNYYSNNIAGHLSTSKKGDLVDFFNLFMHGKPARVSFAINELNGAKLNLCYSPEDKKLKIWLDGVSAEIQEKFSAS